jgi:UDP-glucose 4-epimerase
MNQNAVFDYVYIDDLSRIIEYFIENETKEKFYNVGSENHLDLLTILNKIKKISGKDFEIIIKNPGINKEYTSDNSRLKSELKDFKFTDIDSSIKELYDYYLKNKENIKKEFLLVY